MGQGKPWRNVQQPEFEKAATDIKNQLRGKYDLPLNIALVGPTGAGKSSFINTFKSIMIGRISHIAHTKDGNTSLSLGTRKFTCYEMTEGVHFYDLAGYAFRDSDGADVQYLEAVFNGKVKLNNVHSEDTCFQEPSDKDKPHCIIFMLNANIALLGNEEMKKMAELHDKLPEEISRIVVITKIDEICPKTNKDISYIYHSEEVYKVVKKVVSIIGVEEHAVFPVVNFTKEDIIDPERTVPHLYAGLRAINFASDRCNLKKK